MNNVLKNNFESLWITFESYLNHVWITFESHLITIAKKRLQAFMSIFVGKFNLKPTTCRTVMLLVSRSKKCLKKIEKTVECQQTKSAFIHIGCWCNRNLICKLFPSQFPSKTCVGNFSVAESYSLQRRRQRERRSSDRNMIQRENNLLALEYCIP